MIPLIIGGSLALGGALGGGLMSYFGNKEQADVSREQLAAQQKAAQQAKLDAYEAASMGANALEDYGIESLLTQQDYGQLAADELGYGRDAATQTLTGLTGGAADWMEEGYGLGADTVAQAGGQARQDVLDALQQARGSISPYDVVGRFGGGELGRLMADPSGYLASDPGYNFRLQQGEEAINRSASARGGRLSGRTLEELQGFGQGLASQEFGNAAARAQAMDQQTLSALMNQAGRSDVAGQNLAGLATGAGQNLASLGMQTGGAVAGMQTGLGSNMANLYQGLGGQLAGLQSGSSGSLANLYQGLGQNLGQTTYNMGQGMAGAYGQYGSQQAGITGSMIPQYQIPTGYAGATTAGIGQTLAGLGQNLGSMVMMSGLGSGGDQQANPWLLAPGEAATFYQ